MGNTGWQHLLGFVSGHTACVMQDGILLPTRKASAAHAAQAHAALFPLMRFVKSVLWGKSHTWQRPEGPGPLIYPASSTAGLFQGSVLGSGLAHVLGETGTGTFTHPPRLPWPEHCCGGT